MSRWCALERYEPGEAHGGQLGPAADMQAVIETRLAQLSPAARQLAQMRLLRQPVGRAIHRLTCWLVRSATSKTSEDMLVLALDELWRRRIVRDAGKAMTLATTKSARSPMPDQPDASPPAPPPGGERMEQLYAHTSPRWPPSSPTIIGRLGQPQETLIYLVRRAIRRNGCRPNRRR